MPLAPLPLVLSLAAIAAAPTGEVRVFRDWAEGCDQGRACRAVALLPAGADEGAWTTLTVDRAPGPDAPLVVTLRGLEGMPASLLADGRPIQATFPPGDEGDPRVAAVEPAELLAALRTASRLQVVDASGAALASISLAGASAALLAMDEAQGRLGTVTAAVRPGTRPASDVPPGPALPVVVRATVPPGGAPTVPAERLAALELPPACTVPAAEVPAGTRTAVVGPGAVLALTPCTTGAYDFGSLVWIERGGALVPAPFDDPPESSGAGAPILVNADWDPDRRLLTGFSRGRGPGDCGTRERYAWDGDRFRLVLREIMPECRGATSFVPVRRAEVR